LKKIDLKKVKKVLIIRPGAIGDVLLTTASVRALKKACPDAVIDYLVAPFASKVLEGNPNISRLILFEKNRLKKAPLFVRIIEDFRFYMSLRKGGYDLVFDLFGNLRTALMSFFTGAADRVGFTFRGRKYFYTIKVKPDSNPKYNVYYHLDLFGAVGIPPDGGLLDLIIGQKDRDAVAGFIAKVKGTGPVIGLNPSGTWATKRWPVKKFAALGNIILERMPDARLVIIWGPGERHMAEEIFKGIDAGKQGGVFIAPETTIKQSGALISLFDVMVTNDGAPKHIAVAVGTPTVTIFGPTNNVSWNASGDPLHTAVVSRETCAPCDKTACPEYNIKCMNNIKEEEVFEAVKKILL
jgi:lipopolysaccharide heptosyltransferase II